MKVSMGIIIVLLINRVVIRSLCHRVNEDNGDTYCSEETPVLEAKICLPRVEKI